MKKYLRIILATCLCLSFIFLVAGCAKEDKKDKKEEAFTAPYGYVSVIQVKINPTVNLYISEDEIILAVEYVNTDAKECYKKIEEDLVGAELDQGVDLVVQTAAKEGYFDEKKEISINIIEAKKEDKKNTVLQTATNAAKETLQEKDIKAEVKILSEGKKITEQDLEDAVKKETGKQTDSDKKAADKAAADKAAADKAAADKAEAEKDKKNPLKSLKKNTKYQICKKSKDEAGMIEVFSLTFKDAEYTYSIPLFSSNEEDGNEDSKVITYQGKTYYECGGGGGGGEYALTDETITLQQDSLVFTMTVEGKLVVKSISNTEEFFAIGDILSPQ